MFFRFNEKLFQSYPYKHEYVLALISWRWLRMKNTNETLKRMKNVAILLYFLNNFLIY